MAIGENGEIIKNALELVEAVFKYPNARVTILCLKVEAGIVLASGGDIEYAIMHHVLLNQWSTEMSSVATLMKGTLQQVEPWSISQRSSGMPSTRQQMSVTLEYVVSFATLRRTGSNGVSVGM
jgi:hypothetical protein